MDASEGVEGGDDQADEDRETEEESGEVRNSRKAGQPRMPTKQEKDEHERTHVPFRSWCEHCVRGQASEYKHSTVKGVNAEEEIPRVILDYCFFTEDASRHTTEHESTTEAATSVTALVMKETLCGSVWAYALRSKSVGDDPWIAEQLVDDLRTIGLAKERVIVKSDQEASIVELQGEVAKRRGYEDYGIGTGIEDSTVGDSNSNGKIERAIRDVGNLVRTLRSAIEEHWTKTDSCRLDSAMDDTTRRILNYSLQGPLTWQNFSSAHEGQNHSYRNPAVWGTCDV